MPKAKSRTKKSRTRTSPPATVADVLAGLAAVEAWLSELRAALETIDQDQPVNLEPLGALKNPPVSSMC